MPQGWREALASAGMDTTMERLLPSLRDHSLDKALTFPPLLGKSIQDKSFLSRSKSQLFHNPAGNLGNTISPFQPCQAAGSNLGMGSCAGHSKAPEAVAAPRQPEILPGITWWFRRSTGYISDTQNLSFLFYFKLFISCISVSIATLIQCAQDLFLVPISTSTDSAKSELLFLRAKKAKGWPHPNCPFLLTWVNSWILLGTLMLTAWAKNRSKICVNNYQDEPGSVSWASVHDKDMSQTFRKTQETPPKVALCPSKALVSCKQNPPEAICTVSFEGLKCVLQRFSKKDLKFYQPCSSLQVKLYSPLRSQGGPPYI